jgi:histidine ammonia-lyase
MTAVDLAPGALSPEQVRVCLAGPVQLAIGPEASEAVARGREVIERIIAGGRTVYGVNTGFGQLATTRIASHDLAALQRNLVLSHAAGTGPLLDDAVVRLVLLLKINSLAQGYSGVRPVVVDTLAALLNAGIHPCVPAKGSVGASGDLAPLAHLSLALIGEGEVRREGERVPAARALREAGIAPLVLEAKEGLALLNGTNVSTALALKGLLEAMRGLRAAVVAGAMTVEAALGSRAPFDPRVQAIRGHRGQADVAAAYLALLPATEIHTSHADCDRVQDPYSLRCQPQVMGACLDQLRHAGRVLLTEANAVSDNPLIFSDGEDVISAGNFHAEPVALAADNLALAIAEVGSLSERRSALLVDAQLSQLPPFLVRDPGLNSGFMIAQVTAAALVSENKALAHPRSVDSLPTSANQEDHVSMATGAALRLQEMNANLCDVVAIELLGAAQGISLRRPLRTSEALERAWDRIREVAEPWDRDRYFAPDIAAVSGLVADGAFDDLVAPALFIGPA